MTDTENAKSICSSLCRGECPSKGKDCDEKYRLVCEYGCNGKDP